MSRALRLFVVGPGSVLVGLLAGALLIGPCLLLPGSNHSGEVAIIAYLFLPLAIGFAVCGRGILALLPARGRPARAAVALLVGLCCAGIALLLFALPAGMPLHVYRWPAAYAWGLAIGCQLIYLDRHFVSREEAANPATSRMLVLPAVLALPIVVIAAALAMLYLWLFWNLYLNRADPHTYLLPADYSGVFFVVFDEECGIDPSVESGRLMLTIPPEGVLILKRPPLSGWIHDSGPNPEREVYTVAADGTRTRVERLPESKDQRRASAIYFGSGGAGSIGGPMPGGGSSSKSPLAISYRDMFLINPQARGDTGLRASGRVGVGHVKAAVAACRAQDVR